MWGRYGGRVSGLVLILTGWGSWNLIDWMRLRGWGWGVQVFLIS